MLRMRFAVVDLETTGSKIHAKDKIIQFGCSLIENGKIQNPIEFKLNPERKIPSPIESLTGISQDMVQSAPYFFEIAEVIQNLLKDCVFVAHNVDFDFHFLNMELEEAGFEALTIPAIDTVSLSRVLFPQAQAYSLSDLDHHLDLGLQQAHDAGQDAQATAQLFLKLINKAKQLPVTTVKDLKELSQHFPLQTSLFFTEILKEKEETHSLYKNVEGLCLKKDKSFRFLRPHLASQYPESREDKEALFQGHYEIRPQQVSMMDQVHRYLRDDEEGHLALEAAAGSGKTLAYLLPAVFQASASKPVIISTHSVLLQHQLVEKDLETLKKALKMDVNVAILKSQSHYVDLEQVKFLLDRKPREQTACIYLGKILVWLTETQTGDLDEIVSDKHSHPIWNQVRSRQSKKEIEASVWKDHDFFLKSWHLAKNAQIIVSNHAFLAHHLRDEEPNFKPEANFIFDEAHRLFDYIQESSCQSLSLTDLRFLLNKTFSDDRIRYEKWLDSQDPFDCPIQKDDMEDLSKLRKNLVLALDQLIEDWIFNFHLDQVKLEEPFNQFLKPEIIDEQVRTHMIDFNRAFHSFLKKYIESLEAFVSIYSTLSRSGQDFIDHFYDTYEKLIEKSKLLEEVLLSLSEIGSSSLWLEKRAMKSDQSFLLTLYREEDFQDKLQAIVSLNKIIYTSASLENVKKLYKKLDLEDRLTYIQAPPAFDYANKSRVLLPDTLLPVKDIPKDFHQQMLAYYISFLAQHSQESMLVLFHSLDSLKQVHEILMEDETFNKRPLLVQGVHGSRNRLLRQFSRLESAVLLGSHSFWEGIDLPGRALSLLVLTRLPFDSPDDIWHQIRKKSYLKEKEQDFYHLILPRARQKLKQAFGRLLRKQEDKGIMLVLDDRLIHSFYASYLQKAFPKETPIEKLSMEELKNIDDFFKKE